MRTWNLENIDTLSTRSAKPTLGTLPRTTTTTTSNKATLDNAMTNTNTRAEDQSLDDLDKGFYEEDRTLTETDKLQILSEIGWKTSNDNTYKE